MAEEFYHKYGGPALIIGRFVPIIRTFAPILAGIVQLNFRKFVMYNLFGCAIWVSILTLSGYFLGREFPQIIHYIEYIIVGFIVISFIPILIALIKRKLRHNKENNIDIKNNR